jgi:signal transduction histidine kinase
VARGDFTHRVPRWANDEIGDLAEAFNLMIGELSRADDLRREKEALRRQLLEKVITTQEDERKRIARELHDSTSQTLTSLIVGLKVMESTCQDSPTRAQVEELRQVAAQTLDEVHTLAMELRPRVLDDLGLSAALERLVSEWQSRYKISLDLLIHLIQERLPDDVETALYRIIQEALTNIARHAGARNVSVLVEQRGGMVITVVEDDGIGFDVEQMIGSNENYSHLGLVGIRERAELLGGGITIESTPHQGTSLFIEIPLIKVGEHP